LARAERDPGPSAKNREAQYDLGESAGVALGPGSSLPAGLAPRVARPGHDEGWLTQMLSAMPANACAPQLTSKGGLPYKPRDSWRQFVQFGRMARGLLAPLDASTIAICSERRTTGETDLSTEQAGAQAPPRFPRPHGNERRPQGRRSPPRAWTQAAQCLIPMLGSFRPTILLSLPGLTRQSIFLRITSCEEDGPAGQARG
jgi:hypothetical protein